MYRTYIFLSILALAAEASAQTTLFEINQTDGLYYWSYNDPLKKINESAEAFSLASSGATLTGFDLPTLAWESYGMYPGQLQINDVHLFVTVFGSFQQDYHSPGDGPEFSNPLETVQYDLALPWKWFWDYSFVGTPANPYFKFPAPIHLPGQTVGIQFTFLAHINGSFQPLFLEILFSFQRPPLIGDNALHWNRGEALFAGVNRYNSSTSLPQNDVPEYGYTYCNLDVILYGQAAAQPVLMMAPQALGPGF